MTQTLREPLKSCFEKQKRQRKLSIRVWTWFLVFTPISLTYYSLNTPAFGWLNWYLSIAWSLDFIPSILGITGAALYIHSKKQRNNSTYLENTWAKQQVIFLIPSICRENTIPALCRVIDSIIEYAPKHLKNWRIDIVTEEGAAGLTTIKQIYSSVQIRILVVPKNYQTPKKTKYKARANQYALEIRRNEGENKNNIFVYHLDDDTAVGEDTIKSIAFFITSDKGQYHAAQGILAFPWQLSGSFFSRLADSIRPADDLTRFYFFTGFLRKPLVGFHGEHLLLRSSIEDEIGWDFGPTVKVEDAYFALHFSHRYPKKTTFLDSYSYGASPETIRDLIKQRRRWSSGLLGLLFDPTLKGKPRWLMGLFVANWILSPMRHVVPIFIIAGIIGYTTSPVSQPIVFLWTISFATWIWQYMEGLRINLSVTEKKRRYFLHLSSLLLLFFFITIIETIAVTAGVLDFLKGKQNFEVISKRY